MATLQRADLERLDEIKSEARRKAHGGARPGAGRPPKAIRYAHDVAAQEAKLVAALPELVDLLISAARGGDTSAARYLVDRVLGRVQTQAKPLAEDYSLPWDHDAAENVAEIRARRELGKELAPNRRGPNASREVLAAEHLVVEAELESMPDELREESARAQTHRRGIQERWPASARDTKGPDALEAAKMTLPTETAA